MTNARRARSFGAQAADYAEHRPDYPAAAIDWGLAGAAVEVGRVLDLGAGTGKLAEGLVPRGFAVVAVEPDPQMRAELTRRLPEVDALDGTAERIPVEDASVEAVFAGQAMHWFDLGPALTEIARVLRPGGVFVALWNHDDESVGWVARLTALISTGVSRTWAYEPDNLPEHADFRPFEHAWFRHSQRRTADSLVTSLSTHSSLLVVSAEEREEALNRLREFLARTPETARGEFDRPIRTTALRARRR